MPLVASWYKDFWANDPAETGFSGSVSIYNAPIYTVATLTITGTLTCNTPAIAQTWITGYTVRQPDGSDQFVDVSGSAPSVIGADQVSRVDYFINVYSANCSALAAAEYYA